MSKYIVEAWVKKFQNAVVGSQKFKGIYPVLFHLINCKHINTTDIAPEMNIPQNLRGSNSIPFINSKLGMWRSRGSNSTRSLLMRNPSSFWTVGKWLR